MKNQVLSLVRRCAGSEFWARIRVTLVGLAQDFWKDTAQPSVQPRAKPVPVKQSSPANAPAASSPQPARRAAASKKLWYADRPQVLEKMWGDGEALPGGKELVDLLLAPLGLNKEMNVLDLSAGLGGLARKMAEEFETYVTGLETDPALARRGMTLSVNAGKSKQASIEHYDPATFTPGRHYDCIIARELFYRVIGKNKFFKTIASALKARGHIVFTDYILDPKAIKNEAVTSWMAIEPEASPLSLGEMSQSWTGLGFDMRVNEDLTPMYKRDVLKGLARFAAFLTHNIPEEETKPLVLKEIDLWERRVAAMEHGLKFCRFHAIRV